MLEISIWIKDEYDKCYPPSREIYYLQITTLEDK